MVRSEYLEYLILISTIIFVLIIIRLISGILYPPIPLYIKFYDSSYYIKMAEDPLMALNGIIIAPFCYRILTPFVAWLLPFNLLINFQIITYISSFLTGIVLYETFKEHFEKILAFTGVLLYFCLRTATRNYFFNIWLPDPLSYLFLTLCFWAIIKSKFRSYAVFLFLGVLVKETVLLTIPVLLTFEFFNKGKMIFFKKENLIKYCTSILPGILLFLILRVLIIPDPIYKYDYFELFQIIGSVRINSVLNGDFSIFYQFTLATWGLILIIFPFFNRKSTLIEWIKVYGIFMFYIYCQILIAVDIARVLTAGFYPVILLTLSAIERLGKNKFLINLFFFSLVVIFFIIIIIFNYVYDMNLLFL